MGALGLLRHPEQMKLLRNNPPLIKSPGENASLPTAAGTAGVNDTMPRPEGLVIAGPDDFRAAPLYLPCLASRSG